MDNDNQSTKINDLPGGKIEDEELFDPTFYSEQDFIRQQQLQDQEFGFTPQQPWVQQQPYQEKFQQVIDQPTTKKEKSIFEEDFVLLMVLLYIRTLPITNTFTQEIPFIGNYIRHNNLLITIVSCAILALLYIICKKYLN
jgi:hypothetical protein